MDKRNPLLVSLLGAALAVAPASSCFKPDPDAGVFVCKDAEDCGDGYRCVAQKDGTERSLCILEAEVKPEECDGVDNDKNGLTDDDAATVGLSCRSGLDGECANGVLVCTAEGMLICQGGQPISELCNGLDDDCDGVTDNGYDLQTDPLHCGACGAACAAGAQCLDAACREVECGDGADNDADGATDCADDQCDLQSCGVGCQCQDGGSLELACDDLADNDLDGATDCEDADCAGLPCDALGRVCVSLACACTKGEPAAEVTCSGGKDEDCDGAVDCADADCAGLSCSEADPGLNCSLPVGGKGECVPREDVCDDAADNDGDGATDCADADCAGRDCTADGTRNCGVDATSMARACVDKESVCGDAQDGDGDGATDCDDPDCLGLACDPAEPTFNCGVEGDGPACVPGEADCGDGLDGDGDGLTDCADRDCRDRPCRQEGDAGVGFNCGTTGAGGEPACVAPEEDCEDGLDEDGDGATDCADTACEGKSCADGCRCRSGARTETSCADGVDNDGDGRVDCEDSDCVGQACDAPDAGPSQNCGVDPGDQPACVAREAACDDGLDDDRDGATDCADPDCDGQPCAAGKTCASQICP